MFDMNGGLPNCSLQKFRAANSKYLFSLLKHPKEWGHGANIQGMCCDTHQMV